MDQNAAKILIKNTFNYPFNEENFSKFSLNLLDKIKKPASNVWLSSTFLSESIKQSVVEYKIYGEKEFKDGEKIIIVVVKLKSKNIVEKSRKIQRDFAQWIIDKYDVDACLLAFFSEKNDDWRFSLIRIDYSREDAGKGKINVKKIITPFKRYSYLVGKNEPNHTAQSQLVPLLEVDQEITLDDLTKAFSIEKVTEEFFQKYKELCFKIDLEISELRKKDKLIDQTFKKKKLKNINFSKKLMSQIVFLYFIQKKGWLGIKRNNSGIYGNWGTGPKNFLRRLFNGEYSKYNNFFNDILEPLFYNGFSVERTENIYDKLDCKIPFLNGGIFEPINNYNWYETDIIIKNSTVESILDTFDSFNFTVREEDPLEIEVAVDPEMLGKVFENLIEENIRKGAGAFYTQRSVVRYMCEKSIKELFFRKIGSKFTDLYPEIVDELISIEQYSFQNFFKKLENNTVKKKKELNELFSSICNLLNDIKICDPAIGSGAFPVMLLQRLTNIYYISQNYLGKNKDIYKIKRNFIEKSIYGVDIDESAIEIAKLRLWMSLTIEEQNFENIRPLPNLDFKIISTDSLNKVEINLENKFQIDEIVDLKDKYINTYSYKDKKSLKKKIIEIEKSIFKNNNHVDFNIYFNDIQKGFDLVISNPPYVRIHKQDKDKKSFYKNNYKAAHKDYDLYVLFFERSLQILKEDGVLTFITPDKFLVRDYGEKIREILLQHQITELVDISRAEDAFNAAVYPLISTIVKTSPEQDSKIKVYFSKSIKNLKKQTMEEMFLNYKDCIKGNKINLIFSKDQKFTDKIYSNSKELRYKIKGNIFCGTPRAKDYYLWQNGIVDKKSSKSLNVYVCGNISPYKINHSKKIRVCGLKKEKAYFDNKNKIISNKRWNDFSYKPKILIRGNDKRITAAIDLEGSVFIGVYAIKIDKDLQPYYKYILALLNSNLFQWLFKAQNPSIRIGGGYFSINAPHILRLPYKEPNKQNLIN